MKYTLTFVLVILAAAITQTTTSTLFAAENEHPTHPSPENGMDPESRVQPLKDKILETLFTAQFYRFDIRKRQTGRNTNKREGLTIAKVDQQYIYLEQPTTSQFLPDFQRLFKKGVQIKTPEDARTIEAALNILYPITNEHAYNSLKDKTIRKEGNQWFFIRDMFFRELKGFIFKTDDNGNILSISYSLKIPPQYGS
ncbi:hypothetical protein GCM10023116_34620 [Kistimonas scapharcae]|uniref:Uncharacterized protein n=1 Tax=Kistimonas scapharcae TaxID=1036133 RepID=A0ABP8V6Z1_9GAMM